jgi:hypothetical protein
MALLDLFMSVAPGNKKCSMQMHEAVKGHGENTDESYF